MNSLKVSKIQEGIVIDHIPPGKSLKILGLLETEPRNGETVSVLMNVQSSRMDQKDIIKIEGRKLGKQEKRIIGLLAHGATLNNISDFEVHEKEKVQLPDEVIEILECPNPECITNRDEPVETKFQTDSEGRLECYHCESVFKKDKFEDL